MRLMANERVGGDGGMTLQSNPERRWPAAPHHERSAVRAQGMCSRLCRGPLYKMLLGSGFDAAVRLSSLRYQEVFLVLADKALRQKCIGGLRDSGNVCPMIPPGATGCRAGAWHQLINAAPARAHNRAGRST